MNEQEKRTFYIATCKACLLAQGMKDCLVCRFNIGLAEQPVASVSDADRREGEQVFKPALAVT
jgi:hypothetical protein